MHFCRSEKSMKTCYFFLVVGFAHYAHLQSDNDPSFKAIPLCDSAFLITWIPSGNKSDAEESYTFSYQKIDGYKLGSERRCGRRAQINEGQVKLNEFQENTKYRIIIYEETNETSTQKSFLETTTRKIDFLEPAKPDFDYTIFKENYWNSNIKIKWYPCGRKRECYDEAPGCNFFVKYRIKGAQDFKRISEYNEDYVHIRDCLPGKVYEFLVGSNNLPFETESATQEIIVSPEAGWVSNLTALPLESFRVLLNWEPPKQINSNLTGYKIFYEDIEVPYKFIYPDKYNHIAKNCTGIIISHLLPNTAYRISIAARTDTGLGAVNSIQMRTSKNEFTTSPPFKPQAAYKIIETNSVSLHLKIIWLPCGAERNCRGQNAGSHFKVKYKFENESTYNELFEYDRDFVVIGNILRNATFEFVVVSETRSYQTESEVHRIRC